MAKIVKYPDRRKCKNCGKDCELQNRDTFSNHSTWRDMCATCHDVRTDQVALAMLREKANYGAKLKFLNNGDNVKAKRKEKKISATINPKAVKMLEDLMTEMDITQMGPVLSNDLMHYNGAMFKLGIQNLKERQSIQKEEARKKHNEKQRDKRYKQKAKDNTAKVMSYFDISEAMEVMEKSMKLREEREGKHPVATGTPEEVLEIA